MMSAKFISSAQLYLSPYCPNTTRRSCEASLGRSPGIHAATRGRLFPAKTRAMAAAVCAPKRTGTAHESFYDLLGISETGSISDIKKAYKQLARKYHPDVSPSGSTEEYTKRFIQLKQVYETLSNPQSRALYDLDLARGLEFTFSPSRIRRRQRRMDEEEEWRRRWQYQLDELMVRSMQKDCVSAPGSWGTRVRQRRKNDIFDLGLNN